MPLKLIRRPGSPYWYMRGTVRGIRITESTGSDQKAAADEVRVKREAELLHQSIHGDAVSRTFAAAAVRYLESGGDGTHLGPILDKIGTKKLSAIGQQEIEDLAKKIAADKIAAAPSGRRLETISNATLNRHVYTPAIAVLTYAASLMWCGKPAIRRPKQPKGRVRWVKPDVAEKLIQSAAPHLRPLVLFLFSQGCRISEALYLDWEQVDLDRAHVIFLDTKNGDDRGVPIQRRALTALKAMNRRTGRVFLTDEGKPYADRAGAGGGMVSSAWATMCEKAGVENFTPHDCRHTWATWYYQKNRDLKKLMELGGWRDVQSVMRYTHVNSEHLAASIENLWDNDDIAVVSTEKEVG